MNSQFSYVIFFIFFNLFLNLLLYSQNYSSIITIKDSINKSTIRFVNSKKFEGKELLFEKATLLNPINPEAFIGEKIDLENKVISKVNIIPKSYIDLDIPDDYNYKIESKHKITFFTGKSRNKNIGFIFVNPLIKNKFGKISFLTRYELSVQIVSKDNKAVNAKYSKRAFKNSSVLKEGEWYKIGIISTDMFKITKSLLEQLGVKTKNLLISSIHLFGNGGKLLPEENNKFRPDDLQENPVVVKDVNKNGMLDKADYVVFYGQSPHVWEFNGSDYSYIHNIYTDTNFYFIKIDPNLSQKKPQILNENTGNITKNINTFDEHLVSKKDLYNLIRSGKNWYGEQLGVNTSITFPFKIDNIVKTAPVKIEVNAVARSGSRTSMKVSVKNQEFIIDFTPISIVSSYGDYARGKKETKYFNNVTDSKGLINVNINYIKNRVSDQAWIYSVGIQGKKNINFNKKASPIFFRNADIIKPNAVSKFSFQATNSLKNFILDVTIPYDAKSIKYSFNKDTLYFVSKTDSFREFVIFNIDNVNENVYPISKIENQNLHQTKPYDVLIITNRDFYKQAVDLAKYHKEHDNLECFVAVTEDIYNEFSSGRQDIVALRDFTRKMYNDNTNKLKYLILFGDGSYDYKNISKFNSNFVPVYETTNSLNGNNSSTSDDFFGYLDNNETVPGNSSSIVDIGIGRLPVKNQRQATEIVEKIKNYNSYISKKDWKNLVVLISDDGENGDNNVFIRESETINSYIPKEYNVEKIYLDAFQQISTPGGKRYPEVNDLIEKKFSEGSLLINYTGHGGSLGLASERIITSDEISKYFNPNNFPTFFTATCEFTRLDDLNRNSTGEQIFQKKDGGVISLFTTVRDVGYNTSERINNAFFNTVFKPLNNGQMPRLGDIIFKLKQTFVVGDYNYFLLIGDPVLKLGYPNYNAVTQEINGQLLINADTIGALDKVTIKGVVQDKKGNLLNDFNGTIYPTIYDKEKTIYTLNNDNHNGGIITFKQQKNKLFKGRASITNGRFEYKFVVPKDINFDYGNIKISYYFENNFSDGNGHSDNIILGGISKNPIKDNQGPVCKLYMNDKNFVNGGHTDVSPTFLAEVFDSTGINMIGNGIGHDILLTIDNESKNAITLNNYYLSDKDSYQNGSIRYPLSNLAPGTHLLTLKIWDVNNNSSLYSLDFEVVESKKIEINRVINYPNPFTTSTEFWFEHNQPNQKIFAQVKIFTVSGKLVKTIQKDIINDGFRSTDLKWNGLDEYGNRLAKGVYIYKLSVRGPDFSVAEKYEKIVIL